MTGCSAVNCSNSTKNFRLFIFPVDPARRAKWIQNTRRDKWTPSKNAKLCEIHFEESQFEQNRQDRWKKLKPNAIPTLFNVPNPPPRINQPVRKSIYKHCNVKESSTLTDATNNIVDLPQLEKSTPTIVELQKLFDNWDVNYNQELQIFEETNINDNALHSTSNTASMQDNSTILSEKEAQTTIERLKQEVNYWKQKATLWKQSCSEMKAILYKLYEEVNKERANDRSKIEQHIKDINTLNEQLNSMNGSFGTFLNKDQIKKVEEGSIKEWSDESIIKGLKLRFALGVAGYSYLLSTKYPAPSYSTLMRRIQEFKLEFGIFEDILDLLQHKVEGMDPLDKFCIISYDEMQICPKIDYKASNGKYYGYVTLDPVTLREEWVPCMADLGSKLFLVLVKGIKNHWKQVIACHVTRNGYGKDASEETKEEMRQLVKQFILDCVTAVQNRGLHVVTLSSDLDARNQKVWENLGINSKKEGEQNNSFVHNGQEINCQPDPSHIIKNLKSAMLRQTIYLSPHYVDQNDLPTNEVCGSQIVELWKYELSKKCENRLLHHLKREDVQPDSFQAMNVGAALRFFSPKTQSALITAVKNGILGKEALTTANFVGLMHEFFSLVMSKLRKTSITSRNCDRKYIFLNVILDLFRNTTFGTLSVSSWKPLNFALSLCTSSFLDSCEFLFKNGFDFVLGHRFSQDATENVFSQIRKRIGSMPSALNCLTAVRLISISQYISVIKYSSYMNEDDEYLLSYTKEKKDFNREFALPLQSDTSSGNVTSYTSEQSVTTFSLSELSENLKYGMEINATFYIAGSTTRAIQKYACSNCCNFLSRANLPESDFIFNMKTYTVQANLGGLKQPCWETLNLILHCEYYFRVFKINIIKHGNTEVIINLLKNLDICFPHCCDMKAKIIKHFFKVRSFCLKNFSENCKPLKNVYGTASRKRKRC